MNGIEMPLWTIYDDVRGTKEYLCPSCKESVAKGMNECLNCGQAIDWSE